MKQFVEMTKLNRDRTYEGLKTQTRRFKRPNLMAGDVAIWREPLAKTEDGFACYQDDGALVTLDGKKVPWRWKVNVLASRYMPKALGRSAVKIHKVWTERLGEISALDAAAEGVGFHKYGGQEKFIELWDSVNGDGSFEENREREVICIKYEFKNKWLVNHE